MKSIRHLQPDFFHFSFSLNFGLSLRQLNLAYFKFLCQKFDSLVSGKAWQFDIELRPPVSEALCVTAFKTLVELNSAKSALRSLRQKQKILYLITTEYCL